MHRTNPSLFKEISVPLIEPGTVSKNHSGLRLTSPAEDRVIRMGTVFLDHSTPRSGTVIDLIDV